MHFKYIGKVGLSGSITGLKQCKLCSSGCGKIKKFLRSCLKLYRQVFYRARIECLFIFKGRIAGYVTAKKKETGIIEHKKR
ncbi:MAG: hypothetical protein J6V00_08630, partial [Bacteroidaceae bacterium]|nr:hypothetical protein [Bacteroidaceae bacterium]